MSLFFETIRLEGRKIHNAKYHNHRLNETIAANFGIKTVYDIRDHITLPEDDRLYKCKLIYDTKIRSVTISPYLRKCYRSIRCIDADINYPFKSTDRTAIDTLFDRRGEDDDILIIRDGLLTDTSIANIAIFDGLEWLTPATPLLPGTMRAALLDAQKLKIADITPKSLQKMTKFAIMNTMTGFYQLKNIILKY